MTTSWTQVYIKGLSETICPDNDNLDDLLEKRYGFTALGWVGPGSTIVKRSDDGACRGYAFVSFLSQEGATKAVEQINQYAFIDQHTELPATDTVDGDDSSQLPVSIHAELCTSRPKKKKEKGTSAQHSSSNYARFRRQRGAPVRKHPVIRSSDGSRTGLGNKTK